MKSKTKLVITTSTQFKTELKKVNQALTKYDASNAASLIEWHEKTLPTINALVRCIASNRKEITKGAKFKLATDASIASSSLPKVNVNFKVLKQAQVQHARRVKTLSNLEKNGVTQFIGKAKK
jgi:hypothetical protein